MTVYNYLYSMVEVKVGEYNHLKVLRKTEIGLYLDDGNEGILLPKRFVPPDARAGDDIKVFIYHDSDNRLIATTQIPYAVVGDITRMKVVSTTPQGAFLDWGLMKDLFVPKSQQRSFMRVGGEYLVKLYIDQQSGRTAATEKIASQLGNEELTVKEMEIVDLLVYRETELGYEMIINNKHLGLLHFNEAFKKLQPGDKLKGFVKKIRPDNKIDVMPGQPGYKRVEDELEKMLRLLNENDGYLPYHDKSEPDEIYAFFGMSKKTFKMTIGTLYKNKKIALTKTGIKLVD